MPGTVLDPENAKVSEDDPCFLRSFRKMGVLMGPEGFLLNCINWAYSSLLTGLMLWPPPLGKSGF